MSGIAVQIDDGKHNVQVMHDDFTIGTRGTIAITDAYASPHHAMVRRDGTDWVIEDNGSTNGVWINGLRTYREALAKGDQIRIGRTMLTVVPL